MQMTAGYYNFYICRYGQAVPLYNAGFYEYISNRKRIREKYQQAGVRQSSAYPYYIIHP